MDVSHPTWVQLVGYVASLLVLSTFYMKAMIPLRCVAIVSNVAFLTYGYFAGLYPVFFLHVVLLPLNILRLYQLRRLIEGARRASKGELRDRVDAPLHDERGVQQGGRSLSQGR
jgi:CRP/FNR family cyclic AMP-dependent transcriptional regulator